MKSRLMTIFALCIVCVASVITLYGISKPGFLITDDGNWMVIRLSAFYQALADGQFPVRFLPRLNHSFGYPVSNFLYPGFLYVGSVIRYLGFPFSTSVEIIIGLSVVVGGLAIFFWLRKFFDIVSSVFGSLSFIFSPYLLYDIYTRGSVGELVAISTSIVILAALERRMKIFIPPLIGFLLISHNTLALVFFVFIISYIIVRKLWGMLVPVCIGCIMSSFFWIPAFFERSLVIFDSIKVADPKAFFPQSNAIILATLPLIFMSMLTLFQKHERFYKEKKFIIVVSFVAIFLSCSLSAFLWWNQFLIRFVQFPYRFLSVAVITLPWVFADYIYSQKNKNLKYGIAVVVIVILAYLAGTQSFKAKNVVENEGYFTTNEATTTVADEYMPKWVKTKPIKRADEKIIFYKGRGILDVGTMSTKEIDVDINASEDSVIQVNTIFYPGWGAMLDDKPVEINYKNDLGVMRFFVPAGNHRLLLAFRENIFRFIADVISGIGFILYGIFIVLLLVPKTMRKNT